MQGALSTVVLYLVQLPIAGKIVLSIRLSKVLRPSLHIQQKEEVYTDILRTCPWAKYCAPLLKMRDVEYFALSAPQFAGRGQTF